MSLIDLVQDVVWAIHPAKLDEINAFIELRLNGKAAIDEEAEEAVSGKSGNRADSAYEVRDGVAVIPVYGMLMKRANIFTRFSGGTSYQLLRRDIGMALEDPAVKGIVLDVDSPGGTVDGVFELADFIRESRGRKPIVAVADGMMASAAYLLASAADKVLLGQAAQAGSIGVAATHYDFSERDRQAGIKRTEIFAGRYKRMGTDAEPLSDEAKAYLQSRVDYYYTLFVEAVARSRGITPEEALLMADGRIFIGRQALDVGLADDIGTMGQAFSLASSKATMRRKGGVKMTQEDLKLENPELHGKIFKEGADSMLPVMEAEKEKAFQDGVQTERARVVEILEADGDPEVTRTAIREGMASEQAFKLFFKAEKETREKAIRDYHDSLSESAGHQASEKNVDNGAGFMAEADKVQAERKCKRSEALSIVARRSPELHVAYLASLKQ
ncbi:MAG: signal peptide peptidase SppA [Geobacteraceae bacterium]|nr:signal peptide peptidase SppA [Geobacteraceae bacterium]